MTTVPGFQLFYAAQALVGVIAGTQACYLFYRHRKHREPWYDAYVTFVQSFAVILMLVLELLGLQDEAGMTLTNGEGVEVNLLRFLGWFLTCPIQVAVLCDLHNSVETVISMSRPYYREEDERIINQGTMMAVMSLMLMCATLMATASSSTFKVIYFLTGGILCAYLFYVFGFVFAKYRKLVPQSKSAQFLLPFFYGSWALFPLTAILSPYGFGTVSEGTAATMFALADIPAKNILIFLMGNVRGDLRALFAGETQPSDATPPMESRSPSIPNINLSGVPLSTSQAVSVRSTLTASSANKNLGPGAASLISNGHRQQQQLQKQLAEVYEKLELLQRKSEKNSPRSEREEVSLASTTPKNPPPVPKTPHNNAHLYHASSSTSSSGPTSVASGIDRAVYNFTSQQSRQASTELLPSTPQHDGASAGSGAMLNHSNIQRLIANLGANGQSPVVIINTGPSGMESSNQSNHHGANANQTIGSYIPRPLTPPGEGLHHRVIDASMGDGGSDVEFQSEGSNRHRRVNWSSIPEEERSFYSDSNSDASRDDHWNR